MDENSDSGDSGDKEQKNEDTEEVEERPIDAWMIRPCKIYKEEYKDCTSLKARFHQYFIFGEYIDCSQWKKDLNNCEKWTSEKDQKAYEELIASETDRRLKRFKAHYANDVWKRRSKPPEDWNKPLPQWLQERNANSYLGLISKEIKSTNQYPKEYSLCTIL